MDNRKVTLAAISVTQFAENQFINSHHKILRFA